MKRSFRLLLATVAVLAVMCTGAWAGEIIVISKDDTPENWYDGNTYYVSGDITFTKRITVQGGVTLILSDDSKLNADAGISVYAYGTSKSLTIDVPAGSKGTGTLIAKGGRSAAIGGQYSPSAQNAADFLKAGTITINGGIVEASATSGAGIGGAEDGHGGTVNINGGTVKASSSSDGAGIGGGNGGNSGTITITKGDVKATATGSGAGIGGGFNGSGETITITDGTVYAYASGGGAGIGSGRTGSNANTTGGMITISGGKVKAIGDYDNVNVAGIGRGASAGTANAGTLSSGTGGKAWIEASKVNADKKDFRSGVLIEKSAGVVLGRLTINDEVTIPAGTTLEVNTSRLLSVASGGTLNIVKDAYLDIKHDGLGDPGELRNSGGTIKNDGYVRLLDGTDIKALRMTGSGTVEMGGKTYDNDGNDKNPPAPTPQPTLPQREAVKAVLEALSIDYAAEPLSDDSIDRTTAVSASGLDVTAQMTISQDAAKGAYIEVNGETLSADISEGLRFYKVFRNVEGTETKVHQFGADYVKTADGGNSVEFDAVVVIINSAAPEEKPEGFVKGAIEGQGLVERTKNGFKVVVVWDGEPEDGVAYDPIVAATAAPIKETSRSSDGTCASGVLAPLAIAALAIIKRRKR